MQQQFAKLAKKDLSGIEEKCGVCVVVCVWLICYFGNQSPTLCKISSKKNIAQRCLSLSKGGPMLVEGIDSNLNIKTNHQLMTKLIFKRKKFY